MARKKHHEEHIDETWLIPYSDLLTLLLALFVVLFAVSSVDTAKFEELRQSFSSSFGGGTILTNNGVNVIPGPGTVLPSPGKGDEKNSPPPSETNGPGEDDPGLEELFNDLTTYVAAHEELSNNLGLKLTSDGVLITLSSDVWFETASAVVSPKMRSFAVTLSEILLDNQQGKPPLTIVITGHTDDRPINTVQYPNNWYVSVERAVNFMSVMLGNPNFDPGHFSARGYGEHSPIDTNETEQGRQRNRRVEVLVSLSKEGAEDASVPATAP